MYIFKVASESALTELPCSRTDSDQADLCTEAQRRAPHFNTQKYLKEGHEEQVCQQVAQLFVVASVESTACYSICGLLTPSSNRYVGLFCSVFQAVLQVEDCQRGRAKVFKLSCQAIRSRRDVNCQTCVLILMRTRRPV